MNDSRPARYVQPDLTEARIARQWDHVDRHSSRRALPRRFLPALAVALSCAALIGVALTWNRSAPRGEMDESVLETGALTLADGSRVTVEPGGRARVLGVRADAVELQLEAGAIGLTVPHGKRSFVVHAGRYDVVDLGTHFRVLLAPQGAVSVDVEEGNVEIRDRQGVQSVRRLSAGDAWSNAPVVQPAAASTELVSPDPSPPASTAPAVVERERSAKALLESAEHARLGGQARAAATDLDTLRRRFRHDPRAALAAFELGRLRLDSLGDAAGADEAFRDAIALSPQGPLREDAEARRVEALAAERSPECVMVRNAFLARYPHSVHAAVVSGTCAGE
jgi:FecR-like protein